MEDEEVYDFCWYELYTATKPVPDAGGYKLMDEHPLDTAMRTNDQALRCYYVEHGEKATKADWSSLGADVRATYNRLPIVAGTGLTSGSYFMRTYSEKVEPITERISQEHPMFAYQAS